MNISVEIFFNNKINKKFGCGGVKAIFVFAKLFQLIF